MHFLQLADKPPKDKIGEDLRVGATLAVAR